MRALLLLLALSPLVGRAQVVSSAPESVDVTIYRGGPISTEDLNDASDIRGIGMITETRVLDLPAGVSTVKFLGVAATIVPQSAKFESMPGQIVETNFDYSLIAPGELLARSIDKPVTLVRTEKTGKVVEQKAIVRSGPDGVVLEIDGKLEALHCGGLRERIVFDRVPPELTDKPTLLATVRTSQSGSYRVRLSYLALGFNWSADYVARVKPNGKTLDLSGWITLANRQTTSFINAPVQVIAGNVSVIEDETVPPEINTPEVAASCWPMPVFNAYDEETRGKVFAKRVALGAPAESAFEEVVVTGSFIAQQRELGDYKLYELPEPTTVAAQQIKQVLMLDQKDVPFERIYRYVIQSDTLENESEAGPQRAFVTLRMQNKRAAGLGKPLPAGTVSVLEPTSKERLVLTGEQKLNDVPIGLPVEIELGQAMDMWVRPRVVRQYERGLLRSKKPAADIEVEIQNDKSVPIKFELFERLAEPGLKIAAESHRHTLNKGMPMWTLTLKAHEQATLRYTVVDTAPVE